ncbi:helix-turn-helix transcriptional regulator [Streptomyces sp. RKAG293]|uniref:helix-turn-helix transcriptional regulator n=1 Tax=Streptomyces sp. RKAG293 TaxID=2893403 RepID=UPI0020346D09|nr:helix-turn-helix transcriptional regulator [Streptomyces sp. RKAG293]MCM2423847.1 helix-turn-helix transcriptional regulator [Streptomyces sp. RKAG293]
MEINTGNMLGQYLRARREVLRPEDAGLLDSTRRRVRGLRREEVARRAGVSTDYYIRLEQGRERHPSAQVVDALARALRLDDDERAHLHRLALPRPTGRHGGGRSRTVGPQLTRMMTAWPQTPAVVLDHCLSVVAANCLGQALFAGHTYSGDLVRLVFLDPDARTFYPDWEQVAVSTVAGLRAAVGTEYDDPQLLEVVGELSVRSEAFRTLWARHDFRRKTHESKRFHHPVVGELTLHYETFSVNSAPGQQLVVYHTDPGSPSEEALALLGSYSATGQAGVPRRPEREPLPLGTEFDTRRGVTPGADHPTDPETESA